MDWEKTSIKLTLTDKNNSKKNLVKTFNNIVEKPEKDQVDLLVEAVELLSGERCLNREVFTRGKY